MPQPPRCSARDRTWQRPQPPFGLKAARHHACLSSRCSTPTPAALITLPFGCVSLYTHHLLAFSRRLCVPLTPQVAVIELPFGFVSSDTVGGAGGTCVIRGCVPKKLLVYA